MVQKVLIATEATPVGQFCAFLFISLAMGVPTAVKLVKVPIPETPATSAVKDWSIARLVRLDKPDRPLSVVISVLEV